MNFTQLKQPQENITDFIPATISNDPNTMVYRDYDRLKQLQERELDILKNKIDGLEKSLDNERQKNQELSLKNIENSVEKKFLEKESESKSSLGSLFTPDIIGTFIGSLPQMIESFRGTGQLQISDDQKQLFTWYSELLPEELNVFKLFRNLLKTSSLQNIEQTLYKIKIQNFNQNNQPNVSNKQPQSRPSDTGSNA